MAASPFSQPDCEKRRKSFIEDHENWALARGTAQRPKVVGGHLTLGFGYDLATRKDRPARILADLIAAGIELSVTQMAAILFYGGSTQEQIWSYLAGSSDETGLFTASDIAFVLRLGAKDRADEGLWEHFKDLRVTKAQGEALLGIVVSEKEKELDAYLRKHVDDERLRDELTARSDKRAVLVDMLYQSASFFGEHLRSALRVGDDAAAALEIAFLGNKTPRKTTGLDERNFTRAAAFLGGRLAPRTPAEAEAFLHAVAGRSEALGQALAKRRSDSALEQTYLDHVNAVVKASLERLGVDAALTLQPDGAFKVGRAVPLERLAQAFGLSPLALALVNPEQFPALPDGATPFPAGRPLRLPNAGERRKLQELGVGIGWGERAAAPTPDDYAELRRRLKPPRPGHAARGSERLLASLSPARQAYAEAGAHVLVRDAVNLAAERLRPFLEVPLGHVRDVDPDYLALMGAQWPVPWLESEFSVTGGIPDWPVAPPRAAFSREAVARVAAAIERCVRAAAELDRRVDRWIERRDAASRLGSFY